MIKIYGKPHCPFCDKAVALCESKKLDYVYSSLGRDYSKEQLLEMFPSARTVPQIIVDDEKIGGYDDLVKHLNGE